MTKIQKVLAVYGKYKKSVNAHIAAIGAWVVFMIHSGTWPPTGDQWALLITLVFPGLVVATTTNVVPDPAPVAYVDAPMVPAFPPPAAPLSGD